MHECYGYYVWLPAKMTRSRPIVFGRCVLETGGEVGDGEGEWIPLWRERELSFALH